MVRDINRLNVPKIMKKEPENSNKHDSYLAEKREQDTIRQ